MHALTRACTNVYIRTYMCANMHTYVHTQMCTHMHTLILSPPECLALFIWVVGDVLGLCGGQNGARPVF